MFSETDRENMQIGYKQTMRAIAEADVEKVFLAGDCDEKISVPVEKAASEKNVQVLYIPTMKELGSMCGIEVGASCAVVLK